MSHAQWLKILEKEHRSLRVWLHDATAIARTSTVHSERSERKTSFNPCINVLKQFPVLKQILTAKQKIPIPNAQIARGSFSRPHWTPLARYWNEESEKVVQVFKSHKV